ncbi:MAG: EI24 domain-containing protein [Pseudomonadota bacterium]
MTNSSSAQGGRASSSLALSTGSISRAARALRGGLSDGLHPRLAFLSVGMTLVAGLFWLVVFSVWHDPIWDFAQVAAQWFFQGVGAASEPAASSAGRGAALWGSVVQGLSMFVAFLIALASFALLVMLTLQVMLEVFLMPAVQRQCLKRYPALSNNLPGTVRSNLLTTVKLWSVLLVGVLLWIIPVLGGLAFFALAAYINVRSLVNDALDGVATLEERRQLVKGHRGAMLCLGLCMTLLLLIPFVGLVAPSVLGASVCHLFMPALLALRAKQGTPTAPL